MEAPSNILSVYIGPHLMETLDIIEKRIDEKTFGEQENLELRLDLLGLDVERQPQRPAIAARDPLTPVPHTVLVSLLLLRLLQAFRLQV